MNRPQDEQYRDSDRDACLLPHVNLEDLTKGSSLLIFTRARSECAPDTFAITDARVAAVGSRFPPIPLLRLTKHTMFVGRTAENHGELVAWDEKAEAIEWLHSGKGVRPSLGLLILLAQQRTMDFLVDCCREILHDIEADALTIGALVDHPPAPQGQTVDGFAARAAMAVEAPYRSPAKLDWAKLKSIIAAKAFAAEDHILTLREDPSYFEYVIGERRERRAEMIQWHRARHDSLFKSRGHLRTEAIGDVVADAYYLLADWTKLLHRIQTVRSLQQKYQDEFYIDKELTHDYFDALLKLRNWLAKSTRGPLRTLVLNIAASPQFRASYQRVGSSSHVPNQVAVAERINSDESKVRTKLFWPLRSLWSAHDGKKALRKMDLPALVDELECLLHADRGARSLISDYTSSVISDFAIVSEALRQLDNYQPWATAFCEVKKEVLEKTKTRGIAIPASATPDHALTVMRAFFRVPLTDATQAAIPWKDFLHAMVSLGFTPEKLLWQRLAICTAHSERQSEFQFNEPQPDDKLEYLRARRNGRRLTRAYGWTGDMFELREKEKEKSECEKEGQRRGFGGRDA